MIEVKVSVLLDASPALVGLVETLKGSIASAPCCEASSPAPEPAAPASVPAAIPDAAPAAIPDAAPEQAAPTAPAPEPAAPTAPAKPRSVQSKKATESAGHAPAAPAAIPDAAPEQPSVPEIKTPEAAMAAATGKVDPLPFGDDGRKIDLLTLRRKANALCAMSMDNKDKVFAVLSQMGVSSLPQLKPEQYDECYDLLSQIR